MLGIYEDGIVTVFYHGKHMKIRPSKIILATGASEKFLEFPGNDLPGIYGAGAVQTLMNVAGVKPAERVLMVGAGNIGLIVSYQLKQAGITHLKLVGRGNYVDHMEKDIRNLRTALDILEMAENEEKFQCTIKRTMFPNGCSGKCYYR